ncbi:MAG: MBOAT family O-acyltransferase [Kiritimatiellia bacterium]|jgi:alginate O-acetyltransferase complex protein AlgI
MLFNSLTFLCFLPVVFLLYWFVFNRNLRLQNLFVVVASYIFYGWWDWRFLLLIALTSFCSWLSGILMGDKEDTPCRAAVFRNHRRYVMVANVVLNLGILGFFKYYNFFIESFLQAFRFIGLDLHPPTLEIMLPVGISFYTFQALSYSIDVYRGQIKPTRDIIAFFAYVGFFPQLVAGPIERATNLLPQFLVPRTFNYAQAVDGCRQMLWGFFKKMVVADSCAPLVDRIFATYEMQDGSVLILGAVLFAFQIYGDFSGYSDIAVGCGRLFGIQLMRNFNYPYFSRDIAEFWRRWHISLSTWFRDYLYIPMGGSRVGKVLTMRNILVLFCVSGLWHGANWTYLTWGVYNAVLFLPLLLVNRNRKHLNIVAHDRKFPTLTETLQMCLTFLLVSVGWVFFRAPSVSDAFGYLERICSPSVFTLPRHFLSALPWILILVVAEWFQRRQPHALIVDVLPRVARWGLYMAICLICLAKYNQSAVFIYFQF